MKKIPNPTDKHVGARVRMRRMMLGMSQDKLGNCLGLTFQQVQKYEKGTNRIGASRLQQIATILQVPESFFFEGAPNAGVPAPTLIEGLQSATVSDFLSTRDGVRIVCAFQKIKANRMRQRIVQLIEAVADGDDYHDEAFSTHLPESRVVS